MWEIRIVNSSCLVDNMEAQRPGFDWMEFNYLSDYFLQAGSCLSETGFSLRLLFWVVRSHVPISGTIEEEVALRSSPPTM